MDTTAEPYEIILVNDGSGDGTLELAKNLCRSDQRLKLLSFSRNFGHQVAITAGMDFACGQAVVVIDADLQDPPDVILQMIAKWRDGYDVVYGRRLQRNGETFFKKATAKVFYRLLNGMSDVDLPVDAGDFRLIDRKVCNALKVLPERNRYVRGLVSWLGFRQTDVPYIREERFAGTTKYPLSKMVRLAADAVTSFSYKPLRIVAWLGAAVSLASLVCLVLLLPARLLGFTIPGWASAAALILLANGLILTTLGVIGEYIRRICDEARQRPLYIINERCGFESGKPLRRLRIMQPERRSAPGRLT
jgi:dolichol-phosphate mannosyltransferase